jgi:hypothetical protein
VEVLKALPFLDSYPLWLRYVVAAWLLATAAILGLLVIIPRISENRAPVQKSATASIPSISSIFDHLSAAEHGLLTLDCARYRVASEPEIHTFGRVACEALAELRGNLTALAQFRSVVNGKSDQFPVEGLSYELVSKLLKNGFGEDQYGPNRDLLLALLDKLSQSAVDLSRTKTASQLRRWTATASLTVDDIFIGTGFLEWLVGYEARENLPPSELVRLGPFFDFAFHPEQISEVAVREFRDEKGHALNQYVNILGMYD